MINPNDPLENPAEMLAHPPDRPKPSQEEPIGMTAVNPAPKQRASPDDGDLRQFSNSNRSARFSDGSEHSSDSSPLHHPDYPAKVTGSRAWKRRNHDSSHGTPVRSRLRPTRGDESPVDGASVPEFGGWKENGGVGTNSFAPPNPSYPPPSKPSKPKTRCFPFWF